MQRGQILFDHLWGIPGGAQGRDLALLRTLSGRDGQTDADGGALAAPYVLLDQRDIAENRDNCCNHSLGRAAREYAWHTALHGLKHTVFDRDRLPARVCWGALVAVLFVAAVCVSAGASRFLLSSPSVYVAVDKVGLSGHEAPFPDVSVCPPLGGGGGAAANISEERKRSVEEGLPPMAEMWQEWLKALARTFDPGDAAANFSWSSDPSPAVHELMEQVMIDGGMMSLPSCEEALGSCSVDSSASGCCANSRVVATDRGPCYRVRQAGSWFAGFNSAVVLLFIW